MYPTAMIRRRNYPSSDLHTEPPLLFEAAPSLDRSIEDVRSEVDFTLPPLVYLRELTFSFRVEDSTQPNQTVVYTTKSRSKGQEGNVDEHRKQEPTFKFHPQISPTQEPTGDRQCLDETPSINLHEGRPRVNSSSQERRSSTKSLSTLFKERRRHTDAKLEKEDSATSSLATECIQRTTTTISNFNTARSTLSKSKTFSGLNSRHDKPTPRRIDTHRGFVSPSSKAERPTPPQVMDRFVLVGRSVTGLDRNTARGHHHLLMLDDDDDDENLAGTPAPPPPPSPDFVFPPLHLPSLSDKHYVTSSKVKVW